MLYSPHTYLFLSLMPPLSPPPLTPSSLQVLVPFVLLLHGAGRGTVLLAVLLLLGVERGWRGVAESHHGVDGHNVHR